MIDFKLITSYQAFLSKFLTYIGGSDERKVAIVKSLSKQYTEKKNQNQNQRDNKCIIMAVKIFQILRLITFNVFKYENILILS